MISKKYFDLLDDRFDIDALRGEVLEIINKIGITPENQICLVHRKGHKDIEWVDGAGSSLTFDKNRKPLLDIDGNLVRRWTEKEFCLLNTGLEGTELARIYNELRTRYKISRYRIAIIPPKRCYGWHTDEEVRIHVPIVTAPGCFLITDDGVATHLPADGGAYIFYANNGYHTAINSDYSIDRIHLLINIYD